MEFRIFGKCKAILLGQLTERMATAASTSRAPPRWASRPQHLSSLSSKADLPSDPEKHYWRNEGVAGKGRRNRNHPRHSQKYPNFRFSENSNPYPRKLLFRSTMTFPPVATGAAFPGGLASKR